ncbi:MAG: hypothetical protein QXO65_02480, partial [Candidatus Aenigmatarchaeota archaeon]
MKFLKRQMYLYFIILLILFSLIEIYNFEIKNNIEKNIINTKITGMSFDSYTKELQDKISFEIKDANENIVEADINIIKNEKLVLSSKSNEKINIKINNFKQKLKSIKEIFIENTELNKGQFELKLDEVSEEKGPPRAIKIYAIDPTNLNFEKAYVTVEAAGEELWKCKNWNFTLQECIDNNWTKIMDIIPGENYTFILTNEDPAYAELPPQYIIECTENGAPGTCTFSYLATDDTKYEQFRVGKGTVINRLNVSVNNTNIPDDAVIINATVCILAYRDSILGDDAGDACGIYAGENATGTPTYTVAVPKLQSTCLNWTTSVGNPNLVCGEITSWLNSNPNPIASARKLIIVFDGTEQLDNNVDLWIDYIYANITYTTYPKYSNAGSNVTTTGIGKSVLHYAYWQNSLGLSGYIFSSNYSGSWQNNSFVQFSGRGNWSNVTMQAPTIPGTYGWRIYANNSENNWNVTGIQILNVVNYPPQITLNLPANNTVFNNIQNINFNFTATDDINQTFSCSIYLDGNLNQTNSSVKNNTLTNFLIQGISYGNHNWYINCTDGELNNVSETRYFIINDTIPPLIQFVSPTETNGSIIYRNYIQVNVTASDSGSGLKNITIYLYNSTGSLINSSNSTSSPLFANFTNLPEGLYYFNATAYDIWNNSNATETRSV